MANKAEVAKILGVMAVAYPNFELKKEMIEVYSECLSDMMVATLEDVIKNCMCKCKWFPTIAEIRQEAAGLLMESAGIPNSFYAWKQVEDALGRRDREVHPLANEAVELMGGWLFVLYSWQDKPSIERSRFIKVYDSIYQNKFDSLQKMKGLENYEKLLLNAPSQ
jgi:hypothetical protein